MNAQQLKNAILQDLFTTKDNWEERELKDIVSKECPISYGIVQQGNHIDGGVPVVRPVDLHCKYVSRNYLKCTSSQISDSYSRTILKGEEVLLCVRGTTGIVALATKELEGCNVNRGIVPLLFDKDVNRLFIYYQMQTPVVQEIIANNTMGSALRQINIKDLRTIKLSLPPLAEQHRIVAKIEELLPKVEEYGKAQEALDKLNAELPERLKKSILQEAITGKLVPQDPNDEPASVLLDKIRKEKAKLVKEGKLKKKDLIETPISKDEIPFEIPESWEWVRLGTIISFQNGYAYNSSEMNKDRKGIPVIKSGNLMTLEVVIKPNNDYIEHPNKRMLESKIVKGDMLMCLSSQSDNPEPLGKTAIYKFDTFALLNQRVLKFRPYYDKLTCYLFYTINSFYFWYNVSHQSGGSAQANLKMNHVLGMKIPLPPLAEQHRIVVKIEELLSKIDKLKTK